MRWLPLALALSACQADVMASDLEPRPASDPLTALAEAKTLGGQAKEARAVWSGCVRLSMSMRDAETGEAVGFGEDWAARVPGLVVEVGCDGRTAAFRPLGPDPVFILMRE